MVRRPHARGRNLVRRIFRDLGDTVTSRGNVTRVFAGQAGTQGQISTKTTVTSADEEGVVSTTDIYETYACDCGRLLDEQNRTLGTCGTCGAVTCGSCSAACLCCGLVVCPTHGTAYRPRAGEGLVHLCGRHRWRRILWLTVGGGP